MNREEVLAGWLSLLQLILSKNRHHLQKIDIHLFGIGKFEETLIAKFDQLAELRNGIRHSRAVDTQHQLYGLRQWRLTPLALMRSAT